MPLTSEATRIGQLALAGAAAASVDISIVIPTRNRIASIEKTLQRCLALRPKPTEIVIVDDYSDDNCSEALRRLETGIVKYIRLPSNEGQSLARSVGFATARGKYLVSLDDDSWFLEPDALGRIWDRLESSPNVGILALRGFSPLDPIQAPAERRSLVADHITCGAAYRAGVLHKTGYHLAFLRYEGEETDLNLKIIDAGFDVVLDESIRFFHETDPRSRTADAWRASGVLPFETTCFAPGSIFRSISRWRRPCGVPCPTWRGEFDTGRLCRHSAVTSSSFCGSRAPSNAGGPSVALPRSNT